MEKVAVAADELLLAMSQVLGLVEDLIGSADKKEALISADDVEGLEELLLKEAETSCALRQKEKKLKYGAESLRREIGIKDKTAKLKDICSSVGDIACRCRLTDKRTEMAEAVERLNKQNAKLKELLKCRIGYTDFMLNLLHMPNNCLRSYNMQGMKEEGLGGFSHIEYHI